MKRVLLSLIITLFGVFVYAQEHVEPTEKWKVAEVWGNNYHGWAFHQDHEVDFTVENQDGRFTLTDEEVADAEYLIQKKIAYVNRDHYNQGGMCPIIDEHMRKYRRQYVGFTNDRGDHIVWANFLWDDKLTDEKLASDILFTKGGCGHFWHIKCNLTTRKVYGLEVTAARVKPMVFDSRSGMPRMPLHNAVRPKSMTVPLAPTIPNFTNFRMSGLRDIRAS